MESADHTTTILALSASAFVLAGAAAYAVWFISRKSWDSTVRTLGSMAAAALGLVAVLLPLFMIWFAVATETG